MKNKKTHIVGKITVLAMLLGIAGTSNAQPWGSTTPTTILGTGYTGVQGSSGISGALQITATNGYLQIGPQNSTWCHMETDRGQFYFNKPIFLDNGGLISSYAPNNLVLATGTTASGSTGYNARITILNTNGYVGIGTSTPGYPLSLYSATSPSGGLMEQINNVNYSLLLVSNAGSGGYNWTTQTGDNGIFWSDGLAGGNQNSASGFVLAPWQGSFNSIRIDGVSGNLSVNYNQQSVVLGTCGRSGALNNGNSYIGFNASRSASGTWTAYGDAGSSSNGGETIFGDLNGNLFFANIPKTSASNQAASDATIFSQSAMEITSAGKVVIGSPSLSLTTPGSYKLYVSGGILTEQVTVAVANSTYWADYVFADGYKLKPLSEVEQYLKDNKHLPEVPSATEVQKNGVNVADMDATLLKKIEELTLYMIDLQRQNSSLQKENSNNTAQIQQLTEQVNALTGKK